jgi:quinohemoprotein ethanol dehydrogenase
VIIQGSKNGFFYVLDRVTGQFISAQPFAQVTWAKGIDQATGRPVVNPEAKYGAEPVIIRPGGSGAHNTSPMSFNSVTGLVYIPTTASRGNYSVRVAGQANVRGIAPTRPEPPAIGPSPPEWGADALVAWDPATQQMRWRVPGGGSIGGGTVTTAANLVFQSFGDTLVAHRADTGEVLRVIQTGLGTGVPGPPIMGSPITYQIGGQQYVAVMGGTGLRAGQPPPVAPRVSPPPPKLLVYALNRR